ncbi:aminoacyl-histidine dipeptidase [Lachnospiraceae bacterium 62-26]|jgi:dipeptidase D|nr:cytosol non-specific dipeptidase [Lachnospiraceae bacterium]
MAVLENLEPQKVFRFFEEISQIPRGTFDTKRVSDYCVSFAKERDLEVIQDEANNVIIRKPGTDGYESCEPVILQGHLDMVCEKTADSSHDFKTDGLELYVKDGYLRAKDTTLGSDNGIAVAMAMAVLDSKDIPHPPIEALFTVDEEDGMGGAHAVDLSVLKGRKLINLDSEEEGILITGCAGGIQYETILPVTKEKKSGSLITVRIHGLLGGHSGAEIHKQRGNSNKMAGRFLYRAAKETALNLVSINGGTKDNVITLDTTVEILAAEGQESAVLEAAKEMEKIWIDEFMGEEPGLKVDASSVAVSDCEVFDCASTERVISYLMLCPNGLQEFSRKLEGVVETSLNLGILESREDSVRLVFQIRSSVETRKHQLKEQLEMCAKVTGGEGRINAEYPAWQYNPDSELRQIMVDTYKELYNEEPVVSAIHAGLECGLFLGKRPDLDCVSIGPNLKDVHSVNEALDLESTKRSWEYLTAVLKNCK